MKPYLDKEQTCETFRHLASSLRSDSFSVVRTADPVLLQALYYHYGSWTKARDLLEIDDTTRSEWKRHWDEEAISRGLGKNEYRKQRIEELRELNVSNRIRKTVPEALALIEDNEYLVKCSSKAELELLVACILADFTVIDSQAIEDQRPKNIEGIDQVFAEVWTKIADQIKKSKSINRQDNKQDAAIVEYPTANSAPNSIATKPQLEPELLQGSPLRYAPTNEMGVVFLFSHLCRRMQLQVLSVQTGFPDCIALQRVGGKERRIRIEFEYRSSNFKTHGHVAEECDWIVCWEHDWPEVPAHLKVVELREFFDRGFNVWVDVGAPRKKWPARGTHIFGKRVSKGDLVMFYEASPCQWVRHVYVVSGKAAKEQQGYAGTTSTIRNRFKYRGDPTQDYWHVYTLRRVCVLDPPLQMKSLETKNLAVVKEAIFSQKHNRKITEHWWLLFELIVRRYPDLAGVLAPFSPSRV